MGYKWSAIKQILKGKAVMYKCKLSGDYILSGTNDNITVLCSHFQGNYHLGDGWRRENPPQRLNNNGWDTETNT